MSVVYADRAFLSVNGSKLVDVQSCSLKQNQNAKEVGTMTPDRFNRGFVQGNIVIDISAVIALRKNDPRPKFESIDYETNDIQLTFVVQGNIQAIATGLYLKDLEDNAGGVGDEVKTTLNFGAIKVTDALGNGALFNLQL